MQDYLKHYYQGKNVLITGHTGFKGTWLSIWLHELGAKVIGYALDPSKLVNLYKLSRLEEKIVDIRGDLRDRQHLKHVFEDYQPEIVFHLAAQPLVKQSYEEPAYTFEVNVMGTMNVLECMRESESTKVGIIVTSDKCYENNEWVWGYRESDPMGGYDPYSSSKGCCELLVASYRNSFFHPDYFHKHGKVLATVRAGNVIGGGDWSTDRIIPDCIRFLESKEPISVRHPEAIRPWQHVLEPLGGYLLLGAKSMEFGVAYSGAWNFGPESSNVVSVERLVNHVTSSWGSGTWESDPLDGTKHEAELLSLDISKAKYKLDWQPHWEIDKTIQKTVDWYKNYKNTDVYQLCIDDIQEYLTY